ncbi:GNAT family N-acetyltransferase [Gorillibacterium massiliense]|uniref:GNAT family N-acetyltransferase n=1 Tax=Gorillibacterium massiliense TaxID=1280390 RepID=UPI0012DC77BC|nr:GNAT family N-acetyltransferase [Gorillibacterium massiliense]
MDIKALTPDRVADFVAYCRKHRPEVDDSFLYDEDLHAFEPNVENPTSIAVNDQDEIIAVASLIVDDYNRKGRKARFRIFHSESEDNAVYGKLMEEVVKITVGLDYVFLFVPVVNDKLTAAVEKLRFQMDRYSFLLVREDLDVPDVRWPENFTLRPLVRERDEQVWCEVRNAAFATLKGSETPITSDMVSKMTKADDYLDGGMIILYHGDIPVGLVRCADDDFEGATIMNIGPLAIIPEYQGHGLGRGLLRAALAFARNQGYNRTVLCVNADNERAKALYLQEGFKQVEAVACYQYDLLELLE